MLCRVAMLVVVIAVAAHVGIARWLVESLDRRWLHESIKDLTGRVVWREDWSSVGPIEVSLDYGWLPPGGRPVLIAHALGGAGSARSNSIDVARQSLDLGFRLLEVDVFLDEAGRLRCHHGPSNPPPLEATSCTLPRLLALTAPRGAYVILDIKTDFDVTSKAILSGLDEPALRTLVFQLYRPEHIAMYRQWRQRHLLPGPIVTAYLAHRALDHVADAVDRAGLRAMTVPLARWPALRPHRTRVLVHPVDDCDELAGIRSKNIDGAYLPNSLACLHALLFHA